MMMPAGNKPFAAAHLVFQGHKEDGASKSDASVTVRVDILLLPFRVDHHQQIYKNLPQG